MGEQERLQRKVRVWLFVIALLHLIYLGLLNRAPAPEATQAVSHFARSFAADANAPAIALRH